MPKASAGTEGGVKGPSGHLRVKFKEIAAKTVAADEEKGRPESLRIVFTTGKSTVSKFVPITPAATKSLDGFVPGDAPTTEEALRKHIEQHVIRDEVWADVYGSVRNRLAPPGEHLFKLADLRTYTNRQGDRRCRFWAKTDDGLYCTWTAPWPDIKHRVGEDPDDDWIGDEAEFNPNKGVFQYLRAMGLDWNRFVDKDIVEAEALWNRTPGFGEDVEALLGDPKDFAAGLVAAVARHGPQYVEMEIEHDDQWGLGPTRGGTISMVQMKQVKVVEGVDPDAAEFQKTREWAEELLTNLTKLVTGNDDALFSIGDNFTPEGRIVAKAVLVPVVKEWPKAVVLQDGDERPMVRVLKPGFWHIDGAASVGFLAQSLAVAHATEKTDVTALPNVGAEHIVEWARENVPQFDDIGKADGEAL
jgi:hypothetical protein